MTNPAHDDTTRLNFLARASQGAGGVSIYRHLTTTGWGPYLLDIGPHYRRYGGETLGAAIDAAMRAKGATNG